MGGRRGLLLRGADERRELGDADGPCPGRLDLDRRRALDRDPLSRPRRLPARHRSHAGDRRFPRRRRGRDRVVHDRPRDRRRQAQPDHARAPRRDAADAGGDALDPCDAGGGGRDRDLQQRLRRQRQADGSRERRRCRRDRRRRRQLPGGRQCGPGRHGPRRPGRCLGRARRQRQGPRRRRRLLETSRGGPQRLSAQSACPEPEILRPEPGGSAAGFVRGTPAPRGSG